MVYLVATRPTGTDLEGWTQKSLQRDGEERTGI